MIGNAKQLWSVKSSSSNITGIYGLGYTKQKERTIVFYLEMAETQVLIMQLLDYLRLHSVLWVG